MGSLTCFNCGAIVGTQILIDRDDPPSGSRSLFEKLRFESELEALRKEVQVIGDIRTHQEHRNKSALQAAGRARIKQKMDARKRIRKLEARKTSRFWISLATAKKFFKVVLRVTVWCSLVYALYAWVTYLFF